MQNWGLWLEGQNGRYPVIEKSTSLCKGEVSRLAREVWARSDPQNSDPGRDAEFQCQNKV
jgi:hypothetical protein